MDAQPKLSKAKAWTILLSTFAFLWIFATVIGPWGEKHIPTFDAIVDTIEARDIDSGAYFYTEIDAGFDGPRELVGDIKLMAPERYGFTLPFISGMTLCFIILAIGFKTMPME